MTIKTFQKRVYDYYTNHPRKLEMPWREDHNPYCVLLSEMMLQQTQVKRVQEYFGVFIHQWPTIQDLASASLSEVLHYWQGLGYNRRAKFLHNCAKTIVEQFDGKIPDNEQDLQTLPGIGNYTSAAIMAFAFNYPSVVIDTNIRRVIIHHFFKDKSSISEQEVHKKVSAVLDKSSPRVWYWALMDYGAYLSTQIENPNRKAKIYRKQSKFEGSNRQIRGILVRSLLKEPRMSKKKLVQTIQQEQDFEDYRVECQIDKLLSEGMIVCEKGKYSISHEE